MVDRFAMPVYRLVQAAVFDPDTVQSMVSAYEDSLRMLQLIDRADLLTETVARKVIDVTQGGVRDSAAIRRYVLRAFGKPDEAETSECAEQ
jgi:hypothetical protein